MLLIDSIWSSNESGNGNPGHFVGNSGGNKLYTDLMVGRVAVAIRCDWSFCML